MVGRPARSLDIDLEPGMNLSMNSAYKEAIGKVRTKIVATLGPASCDALMIGRLVDAGADVFRLNFSHGTHEDHTAVFNLIRRISGEKGVQLAVLQDLCGPKIRLGPIPGGVVACDLDAEFTLSAEPEQGGDSHCLTSTHPALADDLTVGQSVLLADGTVAMDVVARGPGWAKLKVTLPGQVRSHQGINVPGAGLSVAALTEKDLQDLEWTRNHDVAYVGLSFVRSAEDIKKLREELSKRGSKARIIAKIEKPQAVANLQAIVAETDAVMIARGDLGVELDVIRVPEIQKRIIETCRQSANSGDHGDPDAGQHGALQPPDARRGERRLQRRARWHRRRHALGRDGNRGLSGRIGGDDEPDRCRSRTTTV